VKAIFLGAGASCDCGMPLVWQLTAVIRKWLTKDKLKGFNQNWKKQGQGWSDEIILRLNGLLDNEKIHYEQIIGCLEDDFLKEGNEQKREEIHAVHSFLLDSVYELLLETQVKNLSYTMSVLEGFKGLKKLVEESRPLWVFSLNHDLVLELLAARLSIPVKSGFKEVVRISMRSTMGEGQNFLSFERLSREDIKRGQYKFFESGEYGINLLKIHGSLDIFGQGDDLNYLKILPINENPLSYVEQLEKVNTINHNLVLSTRVRAINENVYLDDKGVEQFLRKSLLSGIYKFSKRVTQIAPPEFLELFKQYLNSVGELSCVGYGFGDKHINVILRDWLSSSGERRLSMINPKVEIPDTFNPLSKQITIIPKSAADFLM
jgi:hypothetical protein